MTETNYGHVLLRKKAHEIARRRYQIKTASAPHQTQPTAKAIAKVRGRDMKAMHVVGQISRPI
jgi:hypothetical protein